MAVHGDVIDFPSYGRIVLGALFAHGANSSIFHVANHPTLVVKAHHFRTRINGELDVSFSSETVLELQCDGVCAPIEWTIIEDDGRDKGQLAVLFPFLNQYIHLEEVLDNIGEYSEHDRFVLAKNLTKVVSDVHAQGWLHGDLQPRNIMFHPKTLDVQLIDFEWALPENHQNNDDTSFGVDDWMSPELLTYGRKAHSPASEVWTLGKIVLSLLSMDAAATNREFRRNGNLESIRGHIDHYGVTTPVFSFEAENEDLASIFSIMAKATIPKINSRPHIDNLLTQFERADFSQLRTSSISAATFEVVCPDAPVSLKVTDDDFEIRFKDSSGVQRNARIGRSKKFNVDTLGFGFSIILDLPAQPRIQFDGFTYPLSEGFTVHSNQGSWSIHTIEVLK
jgi:serine/threonine protein kinase